MIAWCPRCETNQLENPAPWEPWCAECVYGAPLPEYVAPEPRPDPVERAYYSVSEICKRVDELWHRRYRDEWNTVDLKKLREYRNYLKVSEAVGLAFDKMTLFG